MSSDCYLCQENKEAEKMSEKDWGGRENREKSYPPHMKWGNSLEIRFSFITEKLVFFMSSVTIIHRKKKKKPTHF